MSNDIPHWMQRFNDWCRSTEYMRTTTRPMDAGEQMAQRDAHDLLVEAAAALQSPPPREADAALWPLVERLVRELDDYDLRDEIHGLEPSVADAFDALRAYRPPSAPAPAVTPELADAAKMLTLLGSPCPKNAQGADHDWHECPRCEMLHALEQRDSLARRLCLLGAAALRQTPKTCGTCEHRFASGSCDLDVLDPNGEAIPGETIKNWRNLDTFGCTVWTPKAPPVAEGETTR